MKNDLISTRKVVLKALAKDPAKWYPTARTMAQALEQALPARTLLPWRRPALITPLYRLTGWREERESLAAQCTLTPFTDLPARPPFRFPIWPQRGMSIRWRLQKGSGVFNGWWTFATRVAARLITAPSGTVVRSLPAH